MSNTTRPWAEIDPQGSYLSLPDTPAAGSKSLAIADFVAVNVGDNTHSACAPMRDHFSVLQDCAASLAAHPAAAQQGAPTQELVRDALKAVDLCASKIHGSVKANGGSTFRHVVPNQPFRLTPIPYGRVRNDFALRVIDILLATAADCAQMNTNRGTHLWIDTQTGSFLLSPLMELKSMIAGEYFGVEVRGHLSIEELSALYSDPSAAFPLFVAPTDSESTPDPSEVTPHLEGADILRWKPSSGDLVRLDRYLADVFSRERIAQPEGNRTMSADYVAENEADA